MQTVTTKATAKVAAIVTGLAMATSMLALAPYAHAASLTSAQVSSILSLLTSFGADSATIANVQASLTGGTPSTTTTTTTTGGSCSFSKDLTVGSTGMEVTCLQKALIAGGFPIAAGATGYYGSQTVSAVVAWQKSKNIAPAVGYFGSISRAAFNLGGGSGSTTTTTTGPSAGVGNGLKVMLATDSPNNVALVQGQATGDLAHFTFANPTGSDVKVTNLTFKRIGVSADSAVSNVYLFDGANRITDPAGISNSVFSFNDTSGVITVPAGGVKTIQVRADIAGSTNGQQVGVQLTSLASSGTLDSSVALPINGYTQTISSASMATAVFGTVSQPSGSTSLAPGNDVTVFQSTVTVGVRAVTLKSITLENRGSTVDDDFQNLKLLVKGVQVGSTISKTSGKKVVFDFSSNPIRLETGGNEFRVVADIVGGSGDTADFQVRRAVDAQFIDSNLNQPVLATGDLSGTADTIEGVDLSVTKAANSPSSTIAIDSTGVKMASFEFRAVGDDLKVEQITVDVDDNAVGFTDLANGKVYLNGVQIGSTQDILEAGTTKFSFGSQMILKRGTTAVVDIYADAKQADDTSMTTGTQLDIGVSVATADTEGVKSGDRLGTAVSEVEGNNLTVSSSSLTASKVTSYSNQSVVAGTNNFKIGSFTLAAGANEGVRINTIAIAFASAESSTLTNLRLANTSTHAAISTTKSSVGTTNTFSVNDITIPASGSVSVDVFADVKSSANAGAISATTVTTSTGGTGSITSNSVTAASAATLQTMTVVTSGTLTAAVNTGGTPADFNIVGGATGVKIGSFSFLATNTGFTVNKLLVKVPSNSASAVRTITLKDGATVLKSQGFDLGSPGSAPHATSTFTGLGFVIPAGVSKALDVYVDLVAIDSNNSGLSGQSLSVLLDGDENFEAADGAGNLDTTLTGSTSDLNGDGTNVGVAYVRKSVPTLSAVALDSSVLAAGAEQVLARVKVSADAGGDIDWGSLVFTVNKTSAVTIGATSTLAVYDITGGANTSVGGTIATTTGSHAGTLDALGIGTSGLLHFRPTAVQTVSANSSKTYELRGTIGGLATGNNNVSVSIANPQTTASSTAVFSSAAGTQGISTAASLAWSDWSDTSDHFSSATGASTADWTGDYLIKALPLTVGNKSVSI